MFEYLEGLDRDIFLTLNGWHTPFLGRCNVLDLGKTLLDSPVCLSDLYAVEGVREKSRLSADSHRFAGDPLRSGLGSFV